MIASGTNHGWPGVLGPTLRVNMRKVTFIGWVRTPRTDTVHDRRVEGSASAVGGGGMEPWGPIRAASRRFHSRVTLDLDTETPNLHST
jgi:hypothetical protein